MSRILTAVLALSLLSSASVMAQPNNPNRPDHNDDRNARDRGAQSPDDQHRDNQNRDDRDRDDRNRNERGDDQGRRDEPAARQAVPRWSRGDRVPSQYRQPQYVVSDWRQHGLKTPPRGYVWVRNVNNDFFLAAVSTGVVARTVYRDDRDQLWRQRYSRTYTYTDDVYYRECRNSSDPAGVLVGALIGGLLGNAAGSGGGRSATTIAGVIVGGAVGAALTRNLDCEDRSYAYKSYYDAFNSGRPGSRYEWRNPRNDHRGQFRVGGYYNDPAGFRCATYTQTIYIQGRPQQASGRACRQPDGAWAIVR